jgi:hypothetical protein
VAARKKTSSRKKSGRGRRAAGKKKSSNGPPSLGKEMEKAEEVYKILLELYEDVTGGSSESARGSASGKPDMISLAFRPDGDAASFVLDLIDTLKERRQESGAPAPFTEGRVYCYHCDSTACDHAAPPNHLSVFCGYTPTGFPVWDEFFAVLLEHKDPRIDYLMEGDGEIVSLIQEKAALRAEQLQIFGKHSRLYDIKGQVVAGYLPLPRGDAQARTAVTIQAVRAPDNGKQGLYLNVIGRIPDGRDLVDYLSHHPEPDLEGLFRSARKKLESLPPPRRSNKKRVSTPPGGSLFSVLRHTARGLERMDRRNRRRTRHASRRGEERPAVGLAMKDLDRVQPDRFLYDELHHTFIVTGPKWRIHVFAQDGRHVTSMTINKESFQKRLDQRRWRFATDREMSELRKKVTEIAGADQARSTRTD